MTTAALAITASMYLSLFVSQTFDNQLLQKEILAIEQQIKAAENESAKYSGGLIKTLIDSRIQIYRNTKAIVEQRLAAGKYGVELRFTVQGKTYNSPSDKADLLQQIEKDALQAVREKEALQKEADRYTGGLMRVTKLAAIATLEQELALLEMKRCSLLYDIPFLVPPTVGDTTAQSSSSKPLITQSKTPETSDIDKMITVTLHRKWVFTADYSEHLGLEMSYHNNSDKFIKAVQGVIVFKDLFDTIIQKVRVTIEMPLPPGQTVSDSNKSVELNRFSQEDNRLKTIDMDNLRTECQIQTIIFADGSTIRR